ncbi:MAG: hypothetical protein RI963_943 [Planctomycetota bacterium]|jgi:FixJ family two-component response regulator
MTQTVHLIDDDVSFLRSMGRRLRSQGFAVATYDSVAEFLLRPDADGPGCVLTDLQMPNRDGFELQKLLAQSPNPLPVIFVTGKGDIPTSVRAMRAGAEDFLTKRADSDELLAAIRRAFQRDRGEREARRQRQSARDAIMGLGARELQVLVGVVQGMQNREMATAYGLSERTINYYRTLLTRGLDIYTSVGLSRLVSEAGMSVEELAAVSRDALNQHDRLS